jgi:hypothetical protein
VGGVGEAEGNGCAQEGRSGSRCSGCPA